MEFQRLNSPSFEDGKSEPDVGRVGQEQILVESSVFLEVFSKLLTFRITRMSIQSYYNHSLQTDPNILIALLHI